MHTLRASKVATNARKLPGVLFSGLANLYDKAFSGGTERGFNLIHLRGMMEVQDAVNLWQVPVQLFGDV